MRRRVMGLCCIYSVERGKEVRSRPPIKSTVHISLMKEGKKGMVLPFLVHPFPSLSSSYVILTLLQCPVLPWRDDRERRERREERGEEGGREEGGMH